MRDLFSDVKAQSLPEKVRPTLDNIDNLIGSASLIWKNKLSPWRENRPFHTIFWGPPGSGKTTLAKLLGDFSGHFIQLSAVKHGVKDFKEVAEKNPGSVVFIDEIHRLNKSQQDYLLPLLEFEEIILLGATTENPKVSLNQALLSRLQLVYVTPPKKNDVIKHMSEVIKSENLQHESLKLNEFLEPIAEACQGDVRRSLGLLEQCLTLKSEEEFKELLQENLNQWSSKKHYDNLSAFIKSMRGSDPDAALYYAFKILMLGEDPLTILRRCIIFASEDIGNADPTALQLATAAFHSVQAVGMPEGEIVIAQCVTYLASTVKSNRSYKSIPTVKKWLEETEHAMPPKMLTKGGASQYKYPHNYENHFIPLQYLPPEVAELKKSTGNAYLPSQQGIEGRVANRLKNLWENQAASQTGKKSDS